MEHRTAQPRSSRDLQRPPRVRSEVSQRASAQRLPTALHAGIASLSGFNLSDVTVHRNSSRPAQLDALAYAQGSEIHLGPGQERQLPHEAWHVVQQRQGRVQATTRIGAALINDDPALEREADRMGARAAAVAVAAAPSLQLMAASTPSASARGDTHVASTSARPIQRAVPLAPGMPKPVAVTGGYLARGGRNEVFDIAEYPRSRFSFGVNTREQVFARYNPQRVGNRIVSIRASHGEQVNVEGVQLDHQQSWDNIARAMQAHNQTLRADHVPFASGRYYTLWDARMYYNDLPNLVPALGGLNAAGGAAGVRQIPRIAGGLESIQGEVATAWQNLQAHLVAVGPALDEASQSAVHALFSAIKFEMYAASEHLAHL